MDANSLPELEQVEQMGGADLVVGILDSRSDGAGDPAGIARDSFAGFSQLSRAVVIYNNGSNNGTASSGAITPVGNATSPAVFLYRLPSPAAAETPRERRARACRSVFAVGGRLRARACGLVANQRGGVTALWLNRLVQPVLELGFDLVAPQYMRRKMEGLLNRSILAPLHRALYGGELHNPLGPDFGLSDRLLQQFLAQGPGRMAAAEDDPSASFASTAACGGFQTCEAYLGARSQPPADPTNLSGLLAEVLGPVFLDMERQAVHWQRIRGSAMVTRFGAPEAAPDETSAVDVNPMIDSFQLAVRNLQDVWGAVMPPTTLMEIRKLSRQPSSQFRMPDEAWVRIVYDFALGHRLRTINRDHLLRSFTPLYLGWIASYALEMQNAGAADIEERSQRLAAAYEAGKAYLVSRWRWPDRFNP